MAERECDHRFKYLKEIKRLVTGRVPGVLTPALVSEETEVLTPEPGSEVSVGPESGADIRTHNNKHFHI